MRWDIVTALLAGLSLTACDGSPWLALINSPATSTSKSEQIEIGSYRSLEECRAAAIDAIAQKGWRQGGTYFCGFDCQETNGVHICKKGGR